MRKNIVEKKKTKKGITPARVMALFLGAAILFAGCGGGSSNSDRSSRDHKDKNEAVETESYAYANGGDLCATSSVKGVDYYTDDIYMAEPQASAEYCYDDYDYYYDDYSYDYEGSGSTYQDSQTDIQDENASNTNRKLIRDVSLSLETLEYDTLIATIRGKVSFLGGYIESSYEYNGSNYKDEELRNASMTLRVPADKADEMISEIEGVSNITSRTESVSDVTLSYVDMESHLEMLEIERDTFLEMLEAAETIEDMVYIENCLTDVRYQIESYESQLRTYDNLVDYTTIYIYVTEVKELTPVEPEQEPTLRERIEDGFADSLEELGEKGQDFLINVTSAVPYIILWAVVIVIAYIIVKIIIKLIVKNLSKKGFKVPEKVTDFFAKVKPAKVTSAADTKTEEVKQENTSDDKTE